MTPLCLLTHGPRQELPAFVPPSLGLPAPVHLLFHGEVVCSADKKQGLIKGWASNNPPWPHRGPGVFPCSLEVGEEYRALRGCEALRTQQRGASGYGAEPKASQPEGALPGQGLCFQGQPQLLGRPVRCLAPPHPLKCCRVGLSSPAATLISSHEALRWRLHWLGAAWPGSCKNRPGEHSPFPPGHPGLLWIPLDPLRSL